MKLITKTILYYLLVALPLVVFCMFQGYHFVQEELQDVTDEALIKEAARAQQIIEKVKPRDTLYLTIDSLSFISPGGVSSSTSGPFKDSTIYDPYEEEELPFRFYKTTTQQDIIYTIIIAKPMLEHDDLMESLMWAFGLLIFLLLIAFFVLNWVLSKTLWRPFYKTLKKAKEYDVKATEPLQFENTNTKEFKELNVALQQMTEKISSDFIQQKEFTENASHEMQTPLAVIKANISLLMQSPHLQAEEMGQLEAIDNTTRKLASLNKALILLAKIENHQYKDNSSVSLNGVLKKTVSVYEDMIESKEITLDYKVGEDIQLNMNPALADILMSNLIQNAIRHNQNGGTIQIQTTPHSFIISNTGEPLSISKDELFIRFKKNDASKESLGLGLSIVKSITDNLGYAISYNYENKMHIFTVDFSLQK